MMQTYEKTPVYSTHVFGLSYIYTLLGENLWLKSKKVRH